MNHSLDRRQWLAATGAWATSASALAAPARVAPASAGGSGSQRPFHIYGITYRGKTDVEKGFEEYFAARKVPVRITWRDLNQDKKRMREFLDEIRASKPDLIYTWGTSVTLGVVGPHDGVVKGQHVTDIPVVFTLVAAPVPAKIVSDLAGSRRNVTGVTHVGTTDAQIRAIAAYRPFQNLGVLYTPTEKNTVVILDELRRLGRERGFNVIERTFRLDHERNPMAEGAADLVRELKDSGAQWLYLPPDSFLGSNAPVVIPAAMESGLPTFASTEQLMQAGALSGLVSRYYSVGQFTAHKAEQILVGRQDPARMPVEALKRFSYQIRMAAAHRLKLPPPLPMFNYAELIGETPAS